MRSIAPNRPDALPDRSPRRTATSFAALCALEPITFAAFVASSAFAGVELLDLEYGPLPRDALRDTPCRGKLAHLEIGWRQGSSNFELPGVKVEDLDEPW